MSKHLSSIRVEFPKDKIVKNMEASQKNNKEGTEFFRKQYSKLLLKKIMEDLADSLSSSSDLEECLFDALSDKLNELNDPKFNLKVVKLLKEEIEGQTKLEVSRLVEKRSIVTMEDYIKNEK
jgi:hypothetical protein